MLVILNCYINCGMRKRAVEIFEATDEIVGGDAENSVVDLNKLTLELINSLTPITLETEFVKLF